MVCLCLVFFSCRKKSPEAPPDLGYGYYPTTLGKFVVYDIDSTIYDDFKHDTVYYKYRIKEKFEANFTDNEGRPTIRLVRYMKWYNPLKPYDSIPWTLKDVWAANKTNASVQVVEENVRLTKLSFPVKANVQWNGNAFNTIGEWDYEYAYVNNPEIIGSGENAVIAQVIQKNYRTAISYQYYTEKYAQGIGLVNRVIKDVYSQNVSSLPVEQRIEKGVIYYQTYVTHGYE